MPVYKFPVVGSTFEFRTPDAEFEEVVAVASFFDILAIMLAPNEKHGELRDEMLKATHAVMVPDVDTEGDITASMPVDQVKFLRTAPNFKESFNKVVDAEDGFLYGTISGYICGWCVFRAQFSDTLASASLGAACRMIEKACDKNRIRGGKIDNIKKNKWPIFKPVAHLWAAHELFCEIHDKESLYSGDWHSLEMFIFMAEYIREKGEQLRPKGARDGDTLLSSDETWKVDRSYADPWPDIAFGCDRHGLEFWDAEKNW